MAKAVADEGITSKMCVRWVQASEPCIMSHTCTRRKQTATLCIMCALYPLFAVTFHQEIVPDPHHLLQALHPPSAPFAFQLPWQKPSDNSLPATLNTLAAPSLT